MALSRFRFLLALAEILIIGLLLIIFRGHALLIQFGLISCVVIIVWFISHKKAAAQSKLNYLVNYGKLLVEKQRADLIAASISDGILLLRGQEVLYANPIAERILDLPSKTPVVGFRFDRQGQSALTAGAGAVVKALTSSLPVEFVFQRKDRKQYFLVQSCPVAFDLKGVDKLQLENVEPNLLILAQDVTLLKESQEAKAHFLGTLSHEVKTPVTSLTMAIHLLDKSKDQFPDLTHQNLISTCAQDVDRLRGLLDDLMTVSRFDILAQRLELQKIDLGKLLSHAVQSFRMQAEEKEIQLTQSIALPTDSVGTRKNLMITIDATKIAWALSNLLTNALRHTPRGGRVGVYLDTANDWAQIRVKDTGPGIELHRQERVFEKFNPYYDLRVARSGVVGAGLAIAKEIVTSHGGEIWVSSQPGSGAEFGFRLPITQKAGRAEFNPGYRDGSLARSATGVKNCL